MKAYAVFWPPRRERVQSRQFKFSAKGRRVCLSLKSLLLLNKTNVHLAEVSAKSHQASDQLRHGQRAILFDIEGVENLWPWLDLNVQVTEQLAHLRSSKPAEKFRLCHEDLLLVSMTSLRVKGLSRERAEETRVSRVEQIRLLPLFFDVTHGNCNQCPHLLDHEAGLVQSRELDLRLALFQALQSGLNKDGRNHVEEAEEDDNHARAIHEIEGRPKSLAEDSYEVLTIRSRTVSKYAAEDGKLATHHATRSSYLRSL